MVMSCSASESALPIDRFSAAESLEIVNDFPYQTQELSNTDYAQQNYATACVTACPMQFLLFTTCNDTSLQNGDPYFRLFLGDEELKEDDDSCDIFNNLPQLNYTVPAVGICQNYCLHIGCYDTTSCSAYVEFTAQGAELPTAAPVVAPTSTSGSLTTGASIAVAFGVFGGVVLISLAIFIARGGGDGSDAAAGAATTVGVSMSNRLAPAAVRSPL
jgi:hypothetical protein